MTSCSRSPSGALFVGSPQQIVDKILFEFDLFGHDRFLAHIDLGAVPHRQVMHAIELLGTEVAPVVRREVEAKTGTSPVRTPPHL